MNYSCFICKSMKLERFIKEFDIASMASKCSVVNCFVESQVSLVGDGVSGSFDFLFKSKKHFSSSRSINGLAKSSKPSKARLGGNITNK